MSDKDRENSEHRLRPDLRFSPVRPSGLGEFPIGESGVFDIDGRVHWRKAAAVCDATDGSTTYNYDGEIPFPHRSGSTKFIASERTDKDKRLVFSCITYSIPVEQHFQCPKVGSVTIKDIVKIQSNCRDWSTGYFTIVTTASGECHKFMTSAAGVVNWYEHGYSFPGAPVIPVGHSRSGELQTDSSGLIAGRSPKGLRNGVDRSAVQSYLGEIEHAGPFSQTVRNLWQARKSTRIGA